MLITPQDAQVLPALDRAKWTFTTRRVPKVAATAVLPSVAEARPGDLVLAEVAKIGNHRRVQLSDGRHSALYPGDRLILACADRFAPDQFSGTARLSAEGSDLLAGGGVIGTLTDKHGKSSAPTRLVPLGLLGGPEGRPLNLAEFALPAEATARPKHSFLVVGTGMNAGKTSAAAGVINGFVRLGLRPAAVKLTGTGAFGDLQAYEAAGAARVLDFTDAGMASTHRQPLPRLLQAADTLLDAAALADLSVVELADGIAQGETAELLQSPGFAAPFDGVLLAASDPLAAQAALALLARWGIAPLALTGRLTASPSDAREAGEATGLPVFSREDLCDPAAATALISMAEEQGLRAA
ncbi:MAG: DUF1611 domain-containing protein [Pseudomonadota bacterium]